MCPSHSLLTLPLEIRRHIYSYLIIEPELVRRSFRNSYKYFLSLTCRQLYLEVVEYYFTMNVFQHSLDDYGYLLHQLQRKAGYLEFNLRRVQHLQLEIQHHDHVLCHRVQMKQAEGFRDALIRARQGTVERCWLKSLNIQVSGPRCWFKLWEYRAQGDVDKEIASYQAFLQLFRGITGKLTVLGREVMLMIRTWELIMILILTFLVGLYKFIMFE